MSNKSEEHPQGLLTTDIMNSFFGVEEVDGQLQKIGGGGHERFPDNWYKQHIICFMESLLTVPQVQTGYW
jgi:hypothetical protein